MSDRERPQPAPIEDGVYPVTEAARIIQMDPLRLRRWIRGYTFRWRDATNASPPVFRARDFQMLSFHDLIEASFVKRFLDLGVSLHFVRRVEKEAGEQFNTTHPFCLRRFETDGRTIVARIVDEFGREVLVDLRSKNVLIKQVCEPLLKTLDFTPAGDVGVLWPLGKMRPVVLDPRRAFGAATVASGVPTRVLARAAVGGEEPEAIAEWYGIDVDEVLAAIEFERRLRPSRSRAVA